MKQHLGGFACASRKVAILIAIFMLASGAAWAQKKPKNKAADQSPMPKVPMPVSDEMIRTSTKCSPHSSSAKST